MVGTVWLHRAILHEQPDLQILGTVDNFIVSRKPAIANADKTAKLDALTLTVTASEHYLLEKVHIEVADLGKELARAHLESPQKRIVIKGDRGLPYATMRRVFGQAQEIGFPGVALMVDQKKGARAPAAGEE